MEVKEPIVDNQSAFNFFTSIWIVPIIALIIGGWLIYEHFSKLGPEIKITFKSSAGLQAGQSVIKFRDVPVGKITKIEINNDTDGVIVYARINKDAEAFLNETTKFWIVKPEVDYSGVKGLDTLLSGSYINMYAKKGKERRYEFEGLNSSFIDINGGDYYALEADFAVKVRDKTPIYYKGVKVGQVDSISLDTQDRKLVLIIRIYKEYSNLINETTKFWVQSLLDLKLNDNRLEVNMAPLPIMILGGISLDTKFDKKYKKDFSKIYPLYKSAAIAKRQKIGFAKSKYERFIFNFKGDVSSITKGTKIIFKGFEVGEVKKLKIQYNKSYKGFEAECLSAIDISNFSTKSKDGFSNFKEIANSGLIAVLEKNNPLFNKSNIILKENNVSLKLVKDKRYNAYIIPTKEYIDSGLMAKLSNIADKINKLNLEATVDNINTVLATSKKPIKNIGKVLDETKTLIKNANRVLVNINKVVASKDFKGLSKGLNRTIKELSATLKETKKTLKSYDGNSLFADKLESTLKELHNATEQTNGLLRKLNKKPNALIFGD